MNIRQNAEKDLLDIVFEHRNKNYGAYLLRRNYPTAMRNALILTVGGLVAAFAIPFLLAAANRPDTRFSMKRDVIFETPPDFEKPTVPPPVEIAPPPVSRPIVRYVPPIVLPNEQVKTEPDLLDLGQPIAPEIGKKTTVGDPRGTEFPVDEPIDLGDRKKVDIVKSAPPEAPVIFVENMPQFPGGDAALLKFLAENTKYPNLARETGCHGRVFVSFIVEKSGEMSDIQIVKDPGCGLGQEAARVAKTMPRWKPGNQNGNSVRVRMNLPILFELE